MNMNSSTPRDALPASPSPDDLPEGLPDDLAALISFFRAASTRIDLTDQLILESPHAAMLGRVVDALYLAALERGIQAARAQEKHWQAAQGYTLREP